MVERVNSRVLGDAKNRFAFGVNAPLGTIVQILLVMNPKNVQTLNLTALLSRLSP